MIRQPFEVYAEFKTSGQVGRSEWTSGRPISCPLFSEPFYEVAMVSVFYLVDKLSSFSPSGQVDRHCPLFRGACVQSRCPEREGSFA